MGKDVFVIDRMNVEERIQWNKIVFDASEGTFFHSFDWSDVLSKYGKERGSYSPRHIIVVDGKDNRMVGVLPVFLDRKGCLTSLPSGDYGGPCISARNEEDKVMSLLFSKLEEVARQEAREIRLKSLPDRYSHWLSKLKYKMNPYMYTFLLSTEGRSITDIYSTFRRDTRRGIKKAQKDNLTVENAQSKEMLEKYYQIYQETMERLHASVRSSKFFEILWDTLEGKELLRMFMTKFRGDYIAGLVCFTYKGIMHIYGNVSLSQYLKQRPNDILYFHAIEWCVENNIRIVDFGLTPIDQDSGLYQFKERWGTTRRLLSLTSKKYGLLSRVRRIF